MQEEKSLGGTSQQQDHEKAPKPAETRLKQHTHTFRWSLVLQFANIG